MDEGWRMKHIRWSISPVSTLQRHQQCNWVVPAQCHIRLYPWSWKFCIRRYLSSEIERKMSFFAKLMTWKVIDCWASFVVPVLLLQPVLISNLIKLYYVKGFLCGANCGYSPSTCWIQFFSTRWRGKITRDGWWETGDWEAVTSLLSHNLLLYVESNSTARADLSQQLTLNDLLRRCTHFGNRHLLNCSICATIHINSQINWFTEMSKINFVWVDN